MPGEAGVRPPELARVYYLGWATHSVGLKSRCRIREAAAIRHPEKISRTHRCEDFGDVKAAVRAHRHDLLTVSAEHDRQLRGRRSPRHKSAAFSGNRYRS